MAIIGLEAARLLSEKIRREHKHIFLSYLISENNIKIFEFNRLVKDLNGWSKEEFLAALAQILLLKIKPTALPTK
jgi:hypothetical protein